MKHRIFPARRKLVHGSGVAAPGDAAIDGRAVEIAAAVADEAGSGKTPVALAGE
jgi:hypothetical protein